MGIVIVLIMLVIATAIDFLRMRYGSWKFPHILYGNYDSSIGILFALFAACILTISENAPVLKWIKVIAFVTGYSIVYMFCYYWLNKKRYAPDEKEKKQEYLLHSTFTIKNVIRSDDGGEEGSSDMVHYTIVLEDEQGNEKRIMTIAPAYYERKMLMGKRVQIGKKRMHTKDFYKGED